MIGRLPAILAAALLGASVAADANELRIALKAEPISMDPHFSYSANNQTPSGMMFESLCERDAALQLRPGLALSWTAISDRQWEFKLRPGVTFHDGSRFTAADVAFTFARLPNVPNSPASWAGHAKRAGKVTVIDELTVRFETPEPHPLLPLDISEIWIASHRVGADVTTGDFNSGKATIGTGPYRFVAWTPRERLVVEAHPGYWGAKPAFARASLRPIAVDASRQAALLASDVDMIDVVPAESIARFRGDPAYAVWATRADRVMYLHLDSHREVTPYVTAKGGGALDRNPLRDRRVRLAISKAINRAALVEQIMHGVGEPAGQIAVPGMFAYDPDIRPEAQDLGGARRLLAEAGWPDGFAVTLHATNDRYPNDSRLAQAVAQMLTRIGIEAKVEIMPWAVFSGRASKFELSLFQLGWGSSMGNALHGLRGVVMTNDPAAGTGPSNRGRFSSAELDALIREASSTFDVARSETLQKRAAALAMREVAIVPLYYLQNVWATRKGLRYEARMDERTYPQHVSAQ
jgi:peptide/nickel transport system substrate-binding protein